jgi:hypothetical protein
MVKKILLGLLAVVVVVIAALAIVVALQPSEVHISRSMAMEAPPDKVFEQVNNLHKSPDWSPFIKLDPKIKYSYEGPEAGEGAVYKWSGNDEVGEGSMTIIESKPNELVRMKLAFVRPMEDTAEALFTFQPEGEKVNVTWSMNGTNGFIEKAFCMFVDMDKMIGDKFEEGLASMKEIVESSPTESTPEKSLTAEPAPTEPDTEKLPAEGTADP